MGTRREAACHCGQPRVTTWVTLPDLIRREAPELWDPVRPLHEAGRYADFDPIRDRPAFVELVRG